MNSKPVKTTRARSLRRQETKSEALLWSLLRGKQCGGLKFRRQHPIGSFFAGFVCVSKKLVIEIDGGYHDAIGEKDLEREAYLRDQGWQVIRFADEDVEKDVETVARAILRHVDVEFDFQKYGGRGSGLVHECAPEKPKESVRRAQRSPPRP